jgi:alpha-D-ribose 1-methylphosphonate 5-triphosphate synthase subunit PhnH
MIPAFAGFRNPVFDSQATFRAVMRAMSRPGRIERAASAVDPPPPLCTAAAAACLTLADFETPIWLAGSLRASPVADFLKLHCGAPIVSASNVAAFAVVDLRADALALSDFAQGTPEYPDRGATVILLCDTIGDEDGLSISGPGLRGQCRIGAAPLPADFVGQWRRNRDAFPLGVDLILAAGASLCCLPRSARILEVA